MSDGFEATGVTHARAALLGNPSDGFGGATIAFELPQFAAVVDACHAGSVEIEAEGERLEFADAQEPVAGGRAGTYPDGGPTALLMATSKRFSERLAAEGAEIGALGFELRLRSSDVPRRWGSPGRVPS